MSSTAATLPARPRRRRISRGSVAALVLLAVVAAALGLLAGRSGGGSPPHAHARAWIYTAGDHSFSISYPSGWKAASAGAGAAVIERADHRGVVLVRERPALRGSLSSLVRGLPRELAKRFPDFRPVGATAVRLSTGPAVVYTFVRTKARKVQSIVIAPTAKRSFTLEVVAPAAAHDAARQAGRIVRSLTTP
jgi:hypothetical protein